MCFIFARYTIMWLFLYMHMHNKNEEHKWENYRYLLINEYLLKAYFHFYHIKACSELHLLDLPFFFLDVWIFAQRFSCEEMQRKSLSHIKHQFGFVSCQENFQHLESEALIFLLSLGELNISMYGTYNHSCTGTQRVEYFYSLVKLWFH